MIVGEALAPLWVVLGLLLLVSAAKTLIREPDPDAPLPRWMSSFDRAGAAKLLGMGMLLTAIAAKLWVFTLSALGIIHSASLGSWVAAARSFLLYVAGAQALIVLPAVVTMRANFVG